MRVQPRTLATGAAAAITLAAITLAVAPASSEVRRRPDLAPVPAASTSRPANTTKCNYQDPQPFLIRSNHLPAGAKTPEARREREALHQKAIEYRTKNYGYFEGFGQKAWNPHPPGFYAKNTTFMGLNVRLNERVHPALQCVEEQINAECAATPYHPKRLSTLRTKNTYHTGEISNHVYGIAIDMDPTENTCCGCVAPWNEHPKCQQRALSIYDRMAMPQCWVDVFERFGFYWLGRDKLQDTMHFEFLGDPDKILKAAGAP
jgi:hypothetical protein